MIKVFIYSCLLLVFLINCKSNIPEARNKTDYSQITHYSSRSAHPISSVNFDTIRIDAGNENEMTSLLGSFLFPDFVNVSPKNHLQIMGRYVDVVS